MTLREELKAKFNDPEFIDSVCLVYDDEYNLVEDWKHDMLKAFCVNWMKAIINNIKE